MFAETKRIGHLALTAAALVVATTGTASAGNRIITGQAAFDLGAKDGVVIDNGKIVLGTVGSTFPVLWVANAGEDSVSKIDTRTNKEVARYKTWFDIGLHGAYDGPAPSRTTVDTDGNVFVANRHFDGRPALLIKILASGGIDRNGNGVIDTSTDTSGDGQIQPAEMKQILDTNGNGKVDPGELTDERVAWAVEVGGPNGLGRAACIGTDGNVWVGLFNAQQFYKINGATGAVMSGPHAVPWSPYGCAVDRNGILWSARLFEGQIGRMDTNNPSNARSIGGISNGYGIALGNGKIYSGGSNAYTETDATTEASVFRSGVFGYGISVDINGDIVTGSSTAAKYSKVDGHEIWQNTTDPAQFAIGMVADGDGNIWQVDFNGNRLSKFDGATGALLAQVPVGNLPYTYSDATGISARTQTTQTGFWEIILDGGKPDAKWYKVCWQADTSGGGTTGTDSKAANSQADLANQNFQPRTNCVGLEQEGQFLLLRAKLQAGPNGSSPNISQIAAQTRPCDVNGDGVVTKADVALIQAALGQAASSFADPRDANSDGRITTTDVRSCAQQVTP